MAPATIWRRALKRADRRRDAYLASRSPVALALHGEAVRLANRLYSLAYGLAPSIRSGGTR